MSQHVITLFHAQVQWNNNLVKQFL